MLLGPLGLSFSMLLFGTSTTYIFLVISRFCQGFFNGCVGEYSFILEVRSFIRSYRTGVAQSMITEVRF
jgi:MFS family permease